MRIGFVTCVRLGLECLEEVYEIGGSVDVLFTLRDEIAVNKSGRVWLDDFSRDNGVPLVKVRHISDDEAVAAIRASNLDWLFIIGWSQIAQTETLEAVESGCIGVHPTLLPVGRGRAPIPWAILKGLPETGVTMFVLDEGVDTGPIIHQVKLPLSEHETSTTLYERVSVAHRHLFREVWPKLVNDELTPTAQLETSATTWPGRTPEQGEILRSMSVSEADRLVRAVTHPYPGAFFVTACDEVMRVWSGSDFEPQSGPATPIRLADGTYWAVDTKIESSNDTR